MCVSDDGFFARSMWDLADIIESGYSDRVCIVNYEDLCKSTQGVMDNVHEFLEIDSYHYSKKNFKDLKQTTWELDTFYNHKYPHDIVEGKIKFSKPDNFQKALITNDYDAIINEKFKWIINYCENKVNETVEN